MGTATAISAFDALEHRDVPAGKQKIEVERILVMNLSPRRCARVLLAAGAITLFVIIVDRWIGETGRTDISTGLIVLGGVVTAAGLFTRFGMQRQRSLPPRRRMPAAPSADASWFMRTILAQTALHEYTAGGGLALISGLALRMIM